MVRQRSATDLILSSIDFLRNAQPDLTTSVGSVSRDLFIDLPSEQLAALYEEIARVAVVQSIRFATGSDLDKLLSNYGIYRKSATKSTGTAILTFNSLIGDIPVNSGSIISAKNGSTFSVTSSFVINPLYQSSYKATASKYKADLQFNAINDQYAVEVTVEATAAGNAGNISKYYLRSASISGISNVINTSAFSGGSDSEDDTSFRNRGLSVFSGANTGTSLGYKNVVLSDQAVLDAIVVEPGDDMMTRDGTQVFIKEDGTRVIVSEGTGGKVDIIIFGSRLTESVDSYIYQDKSNTGDPTNSKNDFILGQIPEDAGKTVSRKRVDDLKTGVLPAQPANNLLSVIGSSSGSNFVEKSVDSLGRVSGNYELIKDTGGYAGSPWASDKLHWISNVIKNYSEDKTKSRFNGQDPLFFTDCTAINKAEQTILVTNENSKVESNKSYIKLAHKNINSVTRVFNSTTGERYVVVNQNPDGVSGNTNLTGRIQISGNTLPSPTDTLQVDYSWVVQYDSSYDFDNKTSSSNIRSVIDSIDWGYSNIVKREESIIQQSGSKKTISVSHSVGAVVSVNTFISENANVTLINSRKAIVLSNIISNIDGVFVNSYNAYNTDKKDGSFSAYTLYLPTDTILQVGDAVTVIYNTSDVFNYNGTTGSFSDNIITLPNVPTPAGTIVQCNYIADISSILPTVSITSLPAVGNQNTFNTVTTSNIGTQPTTHIYSFGSIVANKRLAPTRLACSIVGNISPGVLTISGTTSTKIIDAVFVVTNDGLTQNLLSVLKNDLNLKSSDTISPNIYISKISKVEKVTATDNLDVLSSDHTYDVHGYELFNNDYSKEESVKNTSLAKYEFKLSNTDNNNLYAPKIGDKLRITLHYINTSDSEDISFSKSGTLYSEKIFAKINSVATSSGFTSSGSQTATISINNLNQPSTGTRYKTYYDYTSPKQNERITIRYNHDRIINDATLTIEKQRPIDADVLVKKSTSILVDVTMAIVVKSEYTNSTDIVLQNVKDTVTSALNANKLNTIIDASDLIAAAAAIPGVDRVRVMYFNKTGQAGSKLSISANKNENIVANNVIINSESR